MTAIAVDAMGGDFAPRVVVEGAARASRWFPGRLLLVGDLAAMQQELSRHRHDSQRIELRHAPQRVEMDDAASAVLRDKRDSSISLACALVAQGEAQAVISAGHSGAMMVACKHAFGTAPGVERPAIASLLPLRHGALVLLDSGANVDCKPAWLVQFARMGELYARSVLGIAQPRVGLLSNGAEPGKGNELVRAAYPLLAGAGLLNFIGNVEARDLFRGKADVLVCDGFAGNLVLKAAEAAGLQVRLLMRESLGASWLAKAGSWLARRALRELAQRTDYHQVGGSPLLGLKALGMVCHGSSNARSIENAIRATQRCVEQGLVQAIAGLPHGASSPPAPVTAGAAAGTE